MSDKTAILCLIILGLLIIGFITLIIIVWIIYGDSNIDDIPMWALFIMFGGRR